VRTLARTHFPSDDRLLLSDDTISIVVVTIRSSFDFTLDRIRGNGTGSLAHFSVWLALLPAASRPEWDDLNSKNADEMSIKGDSGAQHLISN